MDLNRAVYLKVEPLCRDHGLFPEDPKQQIETKHQETPQRNILQRNKTKKVEHWINEEFINLEDDDE